MSQRQGASWANIPPISVNVPAQHGRTPTGGGGSAGPVNPASGRGRTSPVPGDRRAGPGALLSLRNRQTMAPGQPIMLRQRDKFVPLPDEDGDGAMPPISSLPLIPPYNPASPQQYNSGQQYGVMPGQQYGVMPGQQYGVMPGQQYNMAGDTQQEVRMPLLDNSLDAIGEGRDGQIHSQGPNSTSIFEDLPVQIVPPLPLLPQALFDQINRRGRITLYCVAESFDRQKLQDLLNLTYPPGSILSYPDTFYVEYIKGTGDQPGGDCFFFDYGVVACWGMTKSQEMTLVRGIARQVQQQPLPEKEVETDEFQYNFTITEKPHVQNDTVTLHKRYAQDHKMKLAISYALAQSTKLSVYEQRVVDVVLETKNLPESLAENGSVDISSTEIAKLIGKVFLQKSAVNLLSSVLDTPEFLWHAPDSFQTLYTRVNDYLELPARVELLNSRFSVLQEMLDMLRDHQNQHHNVRLEWIVIWLIVVEVVVGLFELLGLFGMVGSHG